MDRGMTIQTAVCFHWDGVKQIGWATCCAGAQKQIKFLATGFRGSEKGQKFLDRNQWKEIRGWRVLFVADSSGQVLAWAFDGEQNRAHLESWLDAREELLVAAKPAKPSAVVGYLTAVDFGHMLERGIGSGCAPKRRPRLRIAQGQ